MNAHFNKKGSIEVICGSMFCGKTEELIRRIRRAEHARLKVFVFKPEIDDRYDKCCIQSHDGTSHIALPVEKSTDILDCIQIKEDKPPFVVAIDEVQFFDFQITTIIATMKFLGVRVIVAGLDNDFRHEPFGAMPILLAQADHVQKLSAICMVCGEDAVFTQRLVNHSPAHYDDPLILIGGSEAYEPRCLDHYKCPGHPIYDH